MPVKFRKPHKPLLMSLYRLLLKVMLDVRPDLCTNLSSDSFNILLSSASGKLSWPATTVLLLEVVPVDGIRRKTLRKRHMQSSQAQVSVHFRNRFPVKIPVCKIPHIFCTISDILNNLLSRHHWNRRILAICYGQTRFLNSLVKWGYNILGTHPSWPLGNELIYSSWPCCSCFSVSGVIWPMLVKQVQVARTLDA